MPWTRCDYSPFYRQDFSDSPLHMAFLDPVRLALIRTSIHKTGFLKKEVLVLRTIVYREPESDEINLVLPEPKAFLMQSWLAHILKVQRRAKKAWIRDLLGDLDVDPVERDRLLGALFEYVANYTARLHYAINDDVLWVEPRPEAVREALQEFDILPSCA